MGMEEPHRPGAAGGMRPPETARDRRIGGKTLGRFAGQVGDHEPARREAGQQHRVRVDGEPGGGVVDHGGQEFRLVAPLPAGVEGPAAPRTVLEEARSGRGQHRVAARGQRRDQRPVADHPRPVAAGPVQEHHRRDGPALRGGQGDVIVAKSDLAGAGRGGAIGPRRAGEAEQRQHQQERAPHPGSAAGARTGSPSASHPGPAFEPCIPSGTSRTPVSPASARSAASLAERPPVAQISATGVPG